MQSGYLFDGLDLASEYGIYIEKTSGFLDMPKRKGVTEHDWEDEDGVQAFTDADDIYFDARNVSLACHIVADSRIDFLTKLNEFRTILLSSGLHTLKLPYGSMVYNVYYREKSALKLLTKWDGSKMVGKFYVPLREPTPIIIPTAVLLTAPNGGENLQSGDVYTIQWDSVGVTNVKIEYSDDSGLSWRVIDYETTSDGSYSWTMPYMDDSSNCLVKITETNGYDISNSVFSISIGYNTFLDSDGLNLLTSDSEQLKVRI